MNQRRMQTMYQEKCSSIPRQTAVTLGFYDCRAPLNEFSGKTENNFQNLDGIFLQENKSSLYITNAIVNSLAPTLPNSTVNKDNTGHVIQNRTNLFLGKIHNRLNKRREKNKSKI